MTNEQVIALLAHLARIADSLDRLAQPWTGDILGDETAPAVLGAALDLVKIGQDLAQASHLANRISAYEHGSGEMIREANEVTLECL